MQAEAMSALSPTTDIGVGRKHVRYVLILLKNPIAGLGKR